MAMRAPRNSSVWLALRTSRRRLAGRTKDDCFAMGKEQPWEQVLGRLLVVVAVGKPTATVQGGRERGSRLGLSLVRGSSTPVRSQLRGL
jgi:hypothetical protein